MIDLEKYESVLLDNGNTLYYTKVNGTSFEIAIKLKDGTIKDYSHIVDKKLVDVITRCISNRNRIRLWYGDVKTGETWLEEYDVTGVISRSMGDRFKIPILIHNRRSYGGGAILTHCIVRIDDIETRAPLWKVDNFHFPEFRIKVGSGDYPYKVEVKKDNEDWKVDTCFKTDTQAHRWVDFMTGKRYSK